MPGTIDGDAPMTQLHAINMIQKRRASIGSYSLSTVFGYVNTSKQIGDKEHVRIFAMWMPPGIIEARRLHVVLQQDAFRIVLFEPFFRAMRRVPARPRAPDTCVS
jgi:hypothetical protein